MRNEKIYCIKGTNYRSKINDINYQAQPLKMEMLRLAKRLEEEKKVKRLKFIKYSMIVILGIIIGYSFWYFV